VGLAKAASLARQRGVALQTITADVAAWDWPKARFDLIAWIFMHLPPEDRARATQGAVAALAPGGLLVLECFTPAQEGRRSGGPKLRELLWSRTIVEECFAGLEVLELLEGTVLLDEGPRHQGHAEVVRALLRRNDAAQGCPGRFARLQGESCNPRRSSPRRFWPPISPNSVRKCVP
jgi:hypothetical protein